MSRPPKKKKDKFKKITLTLSPHNYALIKALPNKSELIGFLIANYFKGVE